MPPHNLPMTVIGASLLWVGWFGFNAGSALAANGNAGMAMLVTPRPLLPARRLDGIERLKFGKPSVLGIVTGMVAGLGTITPASASSVRWARSLSASRPASSVSSRRSS